MAAINRRSGGGRGWNAASPLVLACCGLLLISSARAADGDDLRASHILEFSDLVREEEQRVRELEAKVAEVTADIQELTASQGDLKTDKVERQIEKIMPAAGLTAVEGPALSVTLDDAPLPPDLGEFNIEDYIVHQQDLEGVINALWAGGAEAMTVMDQRIVSTSTVRCVGSVLLLHGRTFYPPYTITAIGDTEAMREALDRSPAVSEYRDWAERVGLRYDVVDEENVTLSAYTGTVRGGSTS